MRLSYYPGCSMHGVSKEYEISAKLVLKKFDIEFEEIDDWNCCGALEASTISHLLSITLPARNLILTEQKKIVMLCSACQQVHNKAIYELKNNEQLRRQITEILAKPISTDIEIEHLLYFINKEISPEKIISNVKRKLNLKVIPYYGCLVARPSRYIHGDDPNFPTTLEKIITSLGAEALDFSYKTKCCGGALYLTNENLSHGMTENILIEAKKRQADCIVVVCPLCSTALETFSLKKKYEIPILFFTELMGLAFGYEPDELGLNKHLSDTKTLCEKIV